MMAFGPPCAPIFQFYQKFGFCFSGKIMATDVKEIEKVCQTYVMRVIFRDILKRFFFIC